MNSRRSELMAFCALLLAVTSLVFGLQLARPSAAQAPVDSSTTPSKSAEPNAATDVSNIPRTFNYQGILRLADGSLANDTYTMKLRIYDTLIGGTAIYTETVQNVVVRDGLFTVLLGDDPDPNNRIGPDVFADAPRYLGIAVLPDPEMQPRQRLHPVPWALQANTLVPGANIDGNLYIDNSVGIGTTNPAVDLHIVGAGDGQAQAQWDNVNNGRWGQVNRWTNRFEILASDAIEFATDQVGHTKMIITNGGNVGIGTRGPRELLELSKGNHYQLRLDSPDVGGGYWNIGQSDDGWAMGGGKLAFVPDSTYSRNATVVFENTGNVGIGTIDPQSKVHVVSQNTDVGRSFGYLGYYESGDWNKDLYGVYGEEPDGSYGVLGYHHEFVGLGGWVANNYGVYGRSDSLLGAGVSGVGIGDSDGVRGYSDNGLAGEFVGDVHVSGTLTKGGGGFKIDHPLDPENKYLYHSFVESPDMMNVYNGNVVLDENGEAWVVLPDWFEALNKDFRYQLTAIRAPAPNLYVAQEISDNRFKIAGGKSGLKVSWQVTGIRQDPYAEKNRLPVDQDKPSHERGYYLHPDAYGQPLSKGVDAEFLMEIQHDVSDNTDTSP